MRAWLGELAAAYGVGTAYTDGLGQHRSASPEALMAVLRSLGAPIDTPADAESALALRRRQQWSRVAPPVAVAWGGRAPRIDLRLPWGATGEKILYQIAFEDGGTRSGTAPVEHALGDAAATWDGVPHILGTIELPDVPVGVHRVDLRRRGESHGLTLIAAPERAHQDPRPTWGAFAPVYALRGTPDLGLGSFRELGRTLDWVTAKGGAQVATLPLLASFLDEPFDPSPYAPASRLFWNELYLDLDAVPELCAAPAIAAAWERTKVELSGLAGDRLVDYRRQAALRQPVMQAIAESVLGSSGPRREALERFRATRPEVDDYAAFRGAMVGLGGTWQTWGAEAQAGRFGKGDVDDATRRRHLVAQWLAEEQLAALAAHAKTRGGALALDLPVGVGGASWDVWRFREAFALGMSAGAPPDALFTGGQNWGFPPMHPERIREGGHEYLRRVLAHHLRHAGSLRVDHAMHVFRLFWIPQGMPGTQGVYVHYPADELWAIFCLESARAAATLVGEDLGTVPPEVTTAMETRGIRRMYVFQFSIGDEPEQAIFPVAPVAAACVGTHDMPSFAGFWHGTDIADRVDLGLLDDTQAQNERDGREWRKGILVGWLTAQGRLGQEHDAAHVHAACTRWLAASPTPNLLINIEDLWAEPDPQNVPGTCDERPNWRRRMSRTVDAWTHDPSYAALADDLTRQRKTT